MENIILYQPDVMMMIRLFGHVIILCDDKLRGDTYKYTYMEL